MSDRDPQDAHVSWDAFLKDVRRAADELGEPPKRLDPAPIYPDMFGLARHLIQKHLSGP